MAQLLPAIRAIVSGATVFQPAITVRLLRAGVGKGVAQYKSIEALTERTRVF